MFNMMTIKIDTNNLKEKIEKLKIEKMKMDEALTMVKGDSLVLNDYWTGNAGDTASEDLKQYTTIFDEISTQLEKYIIFLEEVSRAYEEEDHIVLKNIEEYGNKSILN